MFSDIHTHISSQEGVCDFSVTFVMHLGSLPIRSRRFSASLFSLSSSTLHDTVQLQVPQRPATIQMLWRTTVNDETTGLSSERKVVFESCAILETCYPIHIRQHSKRMLFFLVEW